MLETLYCVILIATYVLVTLLKRKILNKYTFKGVATLDICIDIVIFVGFLFGVFLILGFDFSTLKVNLKDFVEDKGTNLIWTIIVIIIVVTLLGIVKTLLFKRYKKNPLDIKRQNTISKVLMSLIRYVTYIVCAIVILGIWDINVLPALAGVGIVGLILGLGAQKLISDFVAGLFIVFEHHFDVGDTITVGDFKGEVIDIGLKTTKIKDWHGSVKIIANGELTDIINYSLYDRVFDVSVLINYKEDVERVRKILDEGLTKKFEGRTEIIKVPQSNGVSNFGEYGFEITFIGTTKPESYYQLTRDVRQEIKDLCNQNNIEMALPQLIVKEESK